MRISLSSIILIILCVVPSLLIAQGETGDAPWKYAVVSREGSDNKCILTLSAGTVIKPEGGGLKIISRGDTCIIPKGETAEINHIKVAPFTIELEAPVEGYSLQEIPVSIRRTGHPFSLIDTVADNAGLLEIGDLPPGDYKISVGSRTRGLYADNIAAAHTFDDIAVVPLNEFPVEPSRLRTELAGYDRATETFSIKLTWNDLPFLCSLPYTYRITVDGKLETEATSCEAVLDGVAPGDHKIGVSGVLPSGEQTEEAVSMVYLSNSWMASVDEMAATQEEWQYFDLAGMRVSGADLEEGIYIRTNGRVSQKVKVSGK